MKGDDTVVSDTTSLISRWEQFYGNLLNVNQSNSHEGSEIYTAVQTSQSLVFKR